jgi:hypothetical protein
LKANPWLPHPDTLSSTSARPKSTVNKKQSKRKASEELTYEEQMLDDDEYDDMDSDDGPIPSLDILQPKSKKAKCAPTGSTKVTSPPITRNQAANLKGKKKTIDLTDSLTTTPPRDLQRAQSDVASQVPVTHVVPANQTSKSCITINSQYCG